MITRISKINIADFSTLIPDYISSCQRRLENDRKRRLKMTQIAGNKHRTLSAGYPIAGMSAGGERTTPDLSLSFSRYVPPRMLMTCE